ncbi:MAG: hypothetical protein WC712_06265 [Candidatus Brocadiia bacterium]
MTFCGGIDEAGYGAVLGPLVHGGVAARDGCNWQAMMADAGIRIGDSKRIYRGGDGVGQLERAALFAARLSGWTGSDLKSFLSSVCGPEAASIIGRWPPTAEPVGLPLFGREPIIPPVMPGFQLYARVTMPGHFNSMLARWNKSELAMNRLHGIVGRMLRDFGQEGELIVDRQGGRAFYSAFLYSKFPRDFPMTVSESSERSDYQVGGLRISFLVRSEEESPPVALASMTAKYVRELYMNAFNRHWKNLIPTVTPTAGYPEDGKRFFGEISGVLSDSGIAADEVFRRK